MKILISIIINSSFFYLFLAFFISFLLSMFLYKRQTNLLDVPKYLILVLFFLRFCSFFLLFLLLLKPELKATEKIIEKPLIVFVQDNSSSIVSTYDSVYYKNNYLNKLDSLKNTSNLNIDWITFDNSIKRQAINFNGKSTNISSVLNEIVNMYANTYVSAYILASDGIFNEGLNPVYTNLHFNAPLYALHLGDTTQYKDAQIKSIKCNRITYLGNQAPVEIVIETQGMIGENLTLQVFDKHQRSYSKNPVKKHIINIKKSHEVNSFQFFISPDKPGLQNYHVSLQSNYPEKNILNNKKDFFIDVIDDRKKILILFNSHHPDIAAIKESLESHDEYEVHTYWTSDLNLKDVNNHEYDLIIAHQLSNKFDSNILQRYQSTPIWHIVGHASNLSAFNELQDFVKFDNSNNIFEHSNVALNKQFSSFVINDSLSDFLSLSTPFLTPFSNVSINSLSETLLHKKIGSLNTERPILFFTENDYKSGFLLGEGLWRWRLNDVYLNHNASLFNHFLSQITQYLFLDEDKSRLHIVVDNTHKSNERIFFQAELYNKNFELVTFPDIDIQLTDSLGLIYNYQFIPIDNKYYLDIRLPDGQYNFIATTDLSDEKLIKKGQFIVSNFDLESRDLISNYKLLLDLALNNNGLVISKDSLNYLIDSIMSKADFKPRTYFSDYYQPLINFQSLLILILFSLFLEWFIRRRYINY